MTQPIERPSFTERGSPSLLDDIRQLREASAASRPRERRSLDPRDSLLGMGVGTSPTLLARPVAPRWRRVRTLSLVAAAALVAASGTALAMTGLSRGAEPEGPATAQRVDATGGAETKTDDPSGRATGAPETEPPTEPSDVREPAETDPAEAEPDLDPREARTPRPVRRNPAKPTEPEPEPEPEPTTSHDDGELDSLIDRALGSAPARPEPGEPTLPQTPSRSEVASALRDLQGAVRACADGDSGIVRTRIVVEGATGRVRSVHVTGDFAGTAVGSCVARTVREQAEMPRFARDRFEIAFPYVL